MVREAVKARAARQPVPAQLRRALGQASPASFLETPRLDSGGIEDDLVMCLSGDRFLANLAPVQELLLQIALGIQLAGVDQVGRSAGPVLLGSWCNSLHAFVLPRRFAPHNIHYVNWTCATLWSGSSWPRWTSICSEVTHHACNPAPCLGILLQVQHELLAPSHALEVGVVIIALPTRGVGVVGQGSPSTIGIEPAGKPPLGHRAHPVSSGPAAHRIGGTPPLPGRSGYHPGPAGGSSRTACSPGRHAS